MMMTGQDVSDFENKTVKLISPRIMSLVPESKKEVRGFHSKSGSL